MGKSTVVNLSPTPGNNRDEIENAINSYARVIASIRGEEAIYDSTGKLKDGVLDGISAIIEDKGTNLSDEEFQEAWMEKSAKMLEEKLGEPPGLRGRMRDFFNDPGMDGSSYEAWRRRNN